jgi:O-succinylbenzoic acid--CoA ligase
VVAERGRKFNRVYPHQRSNVRDWLAHRADATPEAHALRDGSGTVTTYAALDDTVEELAGRLSAHGVGVDDHVGVVTGTRPALVEVVHASMRVGATLVPLDARATTPELAERLDAADVDCLLCGADTAERAVDAVERLDRDLPVAGLDGGTDGAADLLGADPEAFEVPALTPDGVEVMLFTSGTTGRPKAVCLTAANLAASAAASAFRLGLDPEDRWHVALPMYHMGGLAPVYRSVLYGTCVLVEDAREGFDPGRTLDVLDANDATCTSLVPTMLRRLLDADEGVGNPFPDSLRFVLLGGAPASEPLLEACAERGVPVSPTYGMTETASQIATATPREAREHPGTVGSPLLFTEVTVVGDDGRAVIRGERGELVVAGPTLTPGYYGETASTREQFCSFGFRTGDVGYRDEAGRLYVLNRLDDRIITGGENVDPGEVLEVVRAAPGVSDAAVVGLSDEEWGQRVAALLVAGGEFDRGAFDAHCRERLADYKLPRTVRLVDSVPRTASGTVDRTAVRERLLGAETDED